MRRSGEPLNAAELLYLGLRIGADVPFCILNGTYRCLGIGEQLLPLAEIPKCYLVVVKPDVGVSTPEAYRACDNVPDGGMRYTPGMVRAVEHRSIEEIANALGNRFDDALQISVVQEIKKYLCENGALNALMTGSGFRGFWNFFEKAWPENAAKRMPAFARVFGRARKRLKRRKNRIIPRFFTRFNSHSKNKFQILKFF